MDNPKTKKEGTAKNRPEVVILTGASAGIGRATARRLAMDGARIGLLARGEEEPEDAHRAVERYGGEALPIPTDVADPTQSVDRVLANTGYEGQQYDGLVQPG
jgi:NADP-dependent 3-hydroxy acid dehydrogenase YdfG